MSMQPLNGFDEKHKALMYWLSLPEPFRDPPSMPQLAAKLGVSRQTLYDWQQYPGWHDALGVIAKQVTVDLEPAYLAKLSAAMLKDSPNDRLVMTYWRYVKPLLLMEKERGDWDRILPPDAGQSYNLQDKYTQAVSQIEQLPIDQHRQFLSILRDLFNQGESNQEVIPQSYNVRKVYTGEEPPPAQELPALPAPPATASDTTATTPPASVPKEFYTSRKPKLKRTSPDYKREKS